MESPQETLEITDSLKRLIRSKARQVVGKAGLTHSDRADVEQDLWLDLLERWPKFRSDRACINTFINRVLNHKVALILRDRRTAKRASSHNGRSLDVFCEDEDGATVTKAVLLHENVHHRRTGQSAPSTFEMLAMKVDMTAVLSSLATRQRWLCEELMERSLVELSRAGILSRTALYQTLYELRRRFEEHGMRTYLREKSVQLAPKPSM